MGQTLRPPDPVDGSALGADGALAKRPWSGVLKAPFSIEQSP